MKKLILLSVVAMSVLVARDCRYEEQELNMLIQQYEDLQNEFQYEVEYAKELANLKARQNFRELLFDSATADTKEVSKIADKMLKSSFNNNYLINQEIQLIQKKYNTRFNRLNQRINQQKQRLNNCRNGK